MKRSRRKSLDVSVEKQEAGSRKRKVPRLDLWVVPQTLEKKLELCERLYEVLKECKGDEGQLLSEFLVRLPSRRSSPDYYQLIQKPIDLLRIQPPTEEYKRAVALEKEFLKSLQLYIETEVEPFSPISPKTVSLKLANLPSPIQATPTGSKSTPTLSKSASVASRSISSPTLPVKIKSTRSKAWLDEYRGSDDPIKIFYADVYTYHDAGGEYIAQPFIEMPSRKNYPEYYNVIVEPIDLTTIKANIDSGAYSTLKPIQDDLLLMIKNAHYFNEPGSFIYKMATTFRRFVVNKCLELERKYKTIQKKSPPPVGEGLKNKRSPPPLGIDLPKSKRYSVGTAEDSESGEDLSVSESEDEGGGASKQRLLLKVKKEKLYKDQNPLEKVMKSKVRPKLKKLLLALYRVLVSAETDDGRSVSELFMRRPSPKLYPEYYIVIAKPIDFKEISKNIRDDHYSSLDSFMEDVELLVNNACTFNEEKSQIHSDALMLRKIALSSHDKLNKRWCAPVTIMDETSDDKVSLVNSIKVLYLSLVNAKDMTGRNLWHTVRDAPSIPEGSEGGGASAKKCIGMSMISQKMEKGEYSSLDVLFSDLCALFDSYCEHHPPSSQPFKDAVMLHRISVTKYNDLTRDRKQAFNYPNVQDQVKKLLLEIVKKTLQYKDESGCALSNALRNVTVCQEMPTKDDAKSRRVFSLEKIHQWASNGRYARLDQLQNDILLILDKGRERGGDNEMGVSSGRGMIRACNALEKAYIQIRDKVCGNEGAGLCSRGNDGVVLWSPALKRTISDVVTEREVEKREKELKQVSVKKSNEDREEEEEKMDTSEQQLLEPIIPVDQRHFTDHLTVQGVVYEPGEYVYMPARQPHLPSQVSLIESLWTDDDGNEWFDGCWFPRPHETYHVASRKFYEKEIFKSDFYYSHRLAKAVGKCCVLYIKDYLKYQPEGFSDEDVFVCESRYLMKQKSMRKIKSWNIYYKHQHVLVPRTTPCSLNKVPSVFVTTTEESESNDGLDPIPEQESGSVHSEERSEEEMREVSVQREDEEEQEGSDVFEMSFFEDLKEVPATVANPEENHAYFEQFCIDDKIFKLGDYVCVRSDQQHPYIARIDKMWTDKEGDPWFHGPWFVRMEETQHRPTRMFYERELLMSNIQDTNPMRSIIRKSAVLTPADYIKLRPTEVLEKDVFVCESRYNEADKSIRKHKSLKTFQLSDTVIPNEVYYLPEELYLWKCHSASLVPTPNCTPRPSQQPPPVTAVATPTPILTTPTPVQATPAPMVTLPLPAGNITFTLPQLQALISSQLVSGTKSTPAPATPPQVGGTTPITTQLVPTPLVPTANQPTTIIAYPCIWGSCNEIFEDSLDLGAHIVRSNHIVQESDGYYCYWKGCPRTKSMSGKPFDSQQKITRHVKEVHMLRMMAQKVSVNDLGTNYHRRGLFIRDSVRTETTPTQLVTPQPTLPPQPLLAIGGQPLVTPDPIPLVSAVVAPSQATPTTVPPTEEVIKSKTTPPSVFVPPPKNIRPVIHSQIYQDYIKRLRTNEPTISPLEPRPVPDTPPDPLAPPSQWVDEGCIPQGMTQVEALYRLRDALIGDALKINKVLGAL